jgi:PAS domain S-box-containing protein
MESVGVVVTNHRQLITHVNKVFAKNTGYSLGELVGRNCKLLQGSETDPEAVRCIRIALEAAEPVEVRLLNYKKDGTAFWSLLRILPLLDGQGRVDGYVGLSVCLGSRFVDQPLSLLRWISPAVLDKQKNQGFVRRGRKLLETEEEVKTCRHISFVAETNLPTRQGVFRVRAYRDEAAKTEPMAIISGDVRGLTEVPVRVHDQCFTSEVLGSLKCDCKEQLHAAMEYIKNNPPGIVIYLQQEGRGMGLANKIKAYSLQEVSAFIDVALTF